MRSEDNAFIALLVVVCALVNCAPALGCANSTGNCNATEPPAGHVSHAAEPLKSMDMLAEDDSTTTTTTTRPKARALNLTDAALKGELSDVTIDEDEAQEEGRPPAALEGKILAPKVTPHNGTTGSSGICVKGGLTYEEGERLENGCESVCTCTKGRMECADRCRGPFFRKGKKIEDALCRAKEVEDPCCAILVCASDTEVEPLEICSYANKTYNRGETYPIACDQICTCTTGGRSACKPRCPPTNKTSDRCVEAPDPNDACCTQLFCDVSLDEHEPDDRAHAPPRLLAAAFLNRSLVDLRFDGAFTAGKEGALIEASADKSAWKTYAIRAGRYVDVMAGTRYLRLEDTDAIVTISDNADGATETSLESKSVDPPQNCTRNGRQFKLDEEYNDNCTSLCVCKAAGMKCLKLECPTYFGVDILDPNCIEWETVPADFVAAAPNCCPAEIKCKNNGSCVHEGATYQNWQELPVNVTGCEKRCHCEMGAVECHNFCPPVTALPPPTLPCMPHEALLEHLPDDDCCKDWICAANPTPDKRRNKTESSTVTPDLGPLEPSKNLGPLLVYTNNASNPKLTPDENPYQKPYVGPLNPSYKKPQKASPPQKPAKSNFVTPPPPGPEPGPLSEPETHIHVTSGGNADDVLQFIKEHPDFTNYAPDSVLVHGNNVHAHKHPFGPPLNHFPNARPDGPYHQLPPGVTLEQILQEIHEHSQQHPNHFNNGLVHPARPNTTRPGQGSLFPGLPPQQDIITLNNLEAIDAHTIRLAFMVPRVIVGLHGRVEVRYTYHDNPDPQSWELQVYAPPRDLIATSQLEFDLLDLKPDTEYKIKITITLRDMHNKPTSKVYKIRTPKDQPATTLPPMIPIEPELAITDINATRVTVTWRKFTDYELQFVDGVQLRFKELDGKVYDATALIHRSVTAHTLDGLRPNAKYELGIFFIPFAGQPTELHAAHMLYFTTANAADAYAFNVTLEIGLLKATSVEIAWSGVSYPEDKYVNIYRAIYQSDSGKEDHSTFKIAKRDAPTRTVIGDLKPGTRYRLWLEVYLTNGKIKTSNVQDFITKPRQAAALGAAATGKLGGGEEREARGDYYGPLVIVAILAAIAIMSTLILLLILVKRHNQNKAAITPPSRVSQSAYDNPTYKVEIQQETMGL